MNLTIEFFIFELVYLSTIFALKLTIAIFLDEICPKRYFRSKTENMNVIITFRLFNLVLVPNFNLNWWLLFFWLDLPKKSFSGKVNPTFFLYNFAYSNWSRAKFQLKLTLLISVEQIYPKRHFLSKTEKVNIIIEFDIFKVVFVPNFSLSWQFDFFDHICPKMYFQSKK